MNTCSTKIGFENKEEFIIPGEKKTDLCFNNNKGKTYEDLKEESRRQHHVPVNVRFFPRAFFTVIADESQERTKILLVIIFNSVQYKYIIDIRFFGKEM